MNGRGEAVAPGGGRPTIVFVNQISGHGHLDLYAKLYSACALELGYAVVLIAEHEGGVTAWLRERCAPDAVHFRFIARRDLQGKVDDDAVREHRPPLPERVRRAFANEGPRGIARRVAFYGRRPFLRAFYALLNRVPGARPVWDRIIQPGHGVSFRALVEEIVAAQARLGVRPDLVFFLYLDMMGEEWLGRRSLDRRLAAPWSGILFHPRCDGAPGSPEPERYFETRTARGAVFLNPHFVPTYAARLPALRFGAVPDVTDASLPDRPSGLVAQIRARANGRTIVSLLGSLGPHKGVVQLMRLIGRVSPRDYFFVIIGEIFWSAFGADEPALRAFAAAPPENCLVQAGYLDDERELNAVIVASDILYAVYTNMRDSSNTLTKASLLERPVLVSDEHLMGERVAAYGIGGTAPPNDLDRIAAELERLRRQPRTAYGFAAYRQDHSIEALRREFGQLARAWTRPDVAS